MIPDPLALLLARSVSRGETVSRGEIVSSVEQYIKSLCCVPAPGLVVSASASVLVGREFDSRPGLTKTGVNWYCRLLQGSHPEHKQKSG